MAEKEALEMLKNEVLQEAILKKERMVARFNEEKERQWTEFKRNVDLQVKKIEEDGKREAESIERKILSLAELEANKYIYTEKGKIIEEIFKKTKDEVINIRRRKSIYAIILERLAKEVIDALGEEKIRLRVNPEDTELIREKVLPIFRKEIELVKDSSVKMGLIGETEHITFDNTLDGIWKRKEEVLRTIVSEELFEK